MVSKTKYIARFLLTYTCVLLPLVTMYLIVTNHMIGHQRGDYQARITQQLTAAVTALNQLDENYNKNSFVLMEHQDMIGNVDLSDEGQGTKIITLLRTVRQFDNVCDDMFVNYSNSNLYTARGLSLVEAYFAKLAVAEGEYDTVLARLVEPKRSVTVMHGESGVKLLMRYPIRSDRLGRLCAVHYTLPIENVCKYLETNFTESGLVLCLNLDDTQDPLYLLTYSDDNAIHLRMIDRPANLPDYTVVPMESTVCDAQIELLYHASQYEQQLNATQTLSVVLLCIGVAVALLISSLFTWSRWQRISDAIFSIEQPHKSGDAPPETAGKLRTWLYKLRQKSRKTHVNDEFDYIQQLFERTRNESTQLEQALRSNVLTMRQQTAMLIFFGIVQSPDDIQHMLRDCGFSRLEKFYCLCGVALHHKNDPALAPFSHALMGDLHCVTPFNDGQLVLMLIELQTEDHFREKRVEMAHHLRDLLQELGAKKPEIAMSQVYQSLADAKDAGMEVMTMLESDTPHTDECWDSRARTDPNKICALKPDDVRAFSDALRNREQADAEKMLRTMNRYIRAVEASNENRWYMRYCLVQAASVVIRESPNRSDQPLLTQLTELDLNEPDVFVQQMRRMIHIYCSHGLQKGDFSQVIAYVDENYGRPDLSLQEIADALKISKPQLSRMFKAQTNTRYTDYLLRLRMTSARDMLVNTDKQIKEIFPLVGFTEKSNFSRKYREYYGESPSDTRRKAAADGKTILTALDEEEDDEPDLGSADPALEADE